MTAGATTEHTCAGATERALFCADCGTLLEPGSLRKVRIHGFTGAGSLSPSVEHFLHTGDPDVFSRDQTTREAAYARPPAA